MFENPPPLPKWAARVVIGAYAWGLVSAVVILGGLLAYRVKEWFKERGGW